MASACIGERGEETETHESREGGERGRQRDSPIGLAPLVRRSTDAQLQRRMSPYPRATRTNHTFVDESALRASAPEKVGEPG